MCCYVGLNYLVVDEFVWICDNIELQLYGGIEYFEEIETTIFYNINCYDVSHRHLMVSRDFVLILYKIIGITKNFFEFWHERGT